ncbi:MAG TPA: hypothetical protein VGK90_08150 [Rhizomicrobium sp.]|jgi:hypothetical protein
MEFMVSSVHARSEMPAVRLIAGSIYVGAVLLASSAHADVVISTDATQNMSCSAGLCTPSAASAVLNANDLETMLGSGNVEVTTTGSGVQANNIDVQANVSWATANTLTFDAYQSIAVANPVDVTSTGGLSLTTNDGGSGGMLSFGHKGNITFQSLSSPLTINGAPYKLVNSVALLASAIAAKPKGNYAFANSYDAGGDGTYSKSPVRTPVRGNVQGLGNAILNITVIGHAAIGGVFLSVGSQKQRGGAIANLGLQNAYVESTGGRFKGEAGGMVVYNWGLLFGDYVSGQVVGKHSEVGGLAGGNFGTVGNSYSSVRIVTKGGGGGLVVANGGTINSSYATGSVSAGGAGGLVGINGGSINNSYALGAATGKGESEYVGGLVYFLQAETGTITSSYSTGKVSAEGKTAEIGGFIGEDDGDVNSTTDCYWNTTTSETENGTGEGNVSGLTGLTTKQMKSTLPTGFDPSVWAEDKKINGGFPYLIANPPEN